MARDNIDIFSLLPESLLLAIISIILLVAATCILNIFLLRIWQSGKNINFNENLFVDSTSNEIKKAQREAFIDFIKYWNITNFTSRRINKFSLTVSNPQTCGETIEHCVAKATQHGVKDLTLDFSNPKWDENALDNKHALFQLPTHVYQLGSLLEALKLYSCGFDMPDLLNFCALKDVSLGWIEVRISTLRTLISTCKTIESLSLKRCWNLVEFDLKDIVQLGLKRLVLNKCDTQCIKLDAPNLKYFKYSGDVFTSEICVSPNVIEEVDIDFSTESKFYKLHANGLCQILIDFKDAKILTVCSYLLQVAPSAGHPVTVSTKTYLNVKHLILKTQMHRYELCGFEFMLNSCPLLEKLTLDISQQVIFKDYRLPYNADLERFWQTRRVFAQCLQNTLKVIEIFGSRAKNQELKTCCFLMKGKALEQINIKLSNEDGNIEFRRRRAQRLLKAPERSENLQITID